MKKLIHVVLLVSALMLSAAEPPAETKPDGYPPEVLQQKPVCRFIPQPSYPFQLRRKEITGNATIEFIVGVTGDVTQAWVVKATHPEFGEAAKKAVLHGKFRPGKLNGKPVRCRMQITEEFRLK